METIKDKTAIVGIGVHKFAKDSGRTVWDMACRAIRDAIDDAGLTPPDIDGVVIYEGEAVEQQAIQRAMGMSSLAYFGDCRWGSGATCSQVLRAAMAVAAGVANNVVFLRSIKESSDPRPEGIPGGELQSALAIEWDFYNPFGLVGDTGRIAMIIRRYMHEFGIKGDEFGWVTTVCREHGAKNPNSIFYKKPITINDYQKSKMVVEPLRKLDCHTEIDGAVAFIITTAERAKRLRQPPAYIMAGAQSMANGSEMMTSYYRPLISGLPEIGNVGRKLFDIAGVTAKDIKAIHLDDSYAPLVPMQLEELGFCGRGEGAAFCDGGDRIRAGGELLLNAAGGSLGEGHIYGLNNIVEAVRQVRGTSTNMGIDTELALVTTGAGGPASGLILRR